VFYYETSLEICISIFSALPHTMNPVNTYDKWSAGMTWFFSISFGLFLICLVVFMFLPCPDPEQRMTRFKAKVGGVYSNIDYSKWGNRLVPLFFVLKRVAFAVGCWYIKIELVALFICLTMVNFCLILHTKPYLQK
jgi:hypothetical protein